ncbi:MAG: GAF domain-containing protein [Candidatus Sulfotelmatobacter sp.]
MLHYAVLLRVADVVSLRYEPGHLFSDLASHLRTLVPLDLINLARVDSSRNIMKADMWSGAESPCEPLEVAAEESAVGSVWLNQAILCIDDLSKERRFEAELRWLRDHEIRYYCVLPLTNFHEKLGALGFGSKQPHAFRGQDIQFLQRVTELVALCVDPILDDTTLV